MSRDILTIMMLCRSEEESEQVSRSSNKDLIAGVEVIIDLYICLSVVNKICSHLFLLETWVSK